MGSSLGFGLLMIMVAAVSGGAFGLQYTIMRKYTVENASLLSLFFATIVVPLIAVNIFLPGWTTAIANAGFTTNLLVFLFGFGWGLGAITYAFAFNFLGMALAAAIIKGLTIAIGTGVPLMRRWETVAADARLLTLLGIVVLLIGTTLSGRAGILRERELKADEANKQQPFKLGGSKGRKLFLLGFLACLASGILSAFVNLGFDFGTPLETAMTQLAGIDLTWKATLIRWMPMYWGGITALMLVMGGNMIRTGTWRNYFAVGSRRDLMIASTMGIVHFFAQIPYGIGAYYLGHLGTSIGFGLNIGMALVVATMLGLFTGEWKGVSRGPFRLLLSGGGVLLMGMLLLAYANHVNELAVLAQQIKSAH
jgi:L-rhamnose-H+ transport protein